MNDKLLATSIYDEELEKWLVYVLSDGELLPVGTTINSELGLFEYCKFDTEDQAVNWIKSNDRLKYNTEFIKEFISKEI